MTIGDEKDGQQGGNPTTVVKKAVLTEAGRKVASIEAVHVPQATAEGSLFLKKRMVAEFKDWDSEYWIELWTNKALTRLRLYR